MRLVSHEIRVLEIGTCYSLVLARICRFCFLDYQELFVESCSNAAESEVHEQRFHY